MNTMASTTPAAQWFMRRFFGLPRFAHHPTCRCFNHHLLRFGSHSFCLGCTCLGFGSILCLVTLATTIGLDPKTLSNWNPWAGIGLGVLFTIPTFVQPFCQKKWFKIISRTSLGVGFTTLWFSSLVLLPFSESGLVLRGVFVLVFLLCFKVALRYRNVLTPKTVCQCGQKAFPYCPENQSRNERLFRQFKGMAGEEDSAMLPVLEAISQVREMGKQMPLNQEGSTVIVENHSSNHR